MSKSKVIVKSYEGLEVQFFDKLPEAFDEIEIGGVGWEKQQLNIERGG